MRPPSPPVPPPPPSLPPNLPVVLPVTESVPLFYYCGFCPRLFTDVKKKRNHQFEVHSFLSKEKREEIMNLGVRKNFELTMLDIGTKIIQRCPDCRKSVPLSNFMEHRTEHTEKGEGKKMANKGESSKTENGSLTNGK